MSAAAWADVCLCGHVRACHQSEKSVLVPTLGEPRDEDGMDECRGGNDPSAKPCESFVRLSWRCL